MKRISILKEVGAVALILGVAMPVSALSVNGVADVAGDVSADLKNAVQVDGNIDADVSVSSDTVVDSNSTTSHQSGGSASASGNIGAEGNATSGSSGIGASIKAMLSSLVSSSVLGKGGSEDADADSSMSGSGSVRVGANGDNQTILITRADLSGRGMVSANLTPIQVDTKADLEAYIAAQLESDENVESIEAAQNSVSVTYKDRAHLFAVIPVMVDATATVDAEGNVEVSYPWYSFLMSTDKAELEAKIQNRVNAIVDAGGDVAANASAAVSGSGAVEADEDGVSANVGATAQAAAQLSTEAQARIVAEVKAAMAEALAEAEAASDVDASANASANANGSANVR